MSVGNIDLRTYYAYVPRRTKPGFLTDGEIRRELAACTGGPRLGQIRAEIEDRKKLRARPLRRWPVRSVLDG